MSFESVLPLARKEGGEGEGVKLSGLAANASEIVSNDVIVFYSEQSRKSCSHKLNTIAR